MFTNELYQTHLDLLNAIAYAAKLDRVDLANGLITQVAKR